LDLEALCSNATELLASKIFFIGKQIPVISLTEILVITFVLPIAGVIIRSPFDTDVIPQVICVPPKYRSKGNELPIVTAISSGVIATLTSNSI